MTYASVAEAALDAELRRLRLRLETQRDGAATREETQIASFLSTLDADALPLRRLCASFGLSAFERDVVVLAAAPEIDGGFADAIAAACGSPRPTVELACRLFAPDPAQALAARASLRDDATLLRLRIVELHDDGPLPLRTLRADARIADLLCGSDSIDARLAAHVLAAPVPARGRSALLAAERIASCVAAFLAERTAADARLVIELSGAPDDDLQAVCEAALAVHGVGTLCVDARTFPRELAPVLVREAVLQPAAPLIRGLDPHAADALEHARELLGDVPIAFVLATAGGALPARYDGARRVAIALPRADAAERAALWRAAAPADVGDDALTGIAERFELAPSEIARAVGGAVNRAWYRGAPVARADVVEAARAQAQHRLGELAQAMHATATWDDLVLPAGDIARLRELADQATFQARVFEQSGFAALRPRGRAATALFCGPSGTGKTLAADVMANALDRELYRVDLGRVVSKYVGETEKNLAEIFREAERARCVLFFDEADALFGKRTEVRDSHDRYANLEVSYLLQLVEDAEHAVVLLATNRREAVDNAFVRRFRFVIEFALPPADMRLAIWQRAFPRGFDTSALRFDAVAERLAISGASIKNIALASAFLAARDGVAVQPRHLLAAARRELDKLARSLPFAEADVAARGPESAR